MTEPREHQAGLLTIRFDLLFHEHTVSVRIEPEESERRTLAHRAQHLWSEAFARTSNGTHFVHPAATPVSASVEPGHRIVPVSEGSHQNTAPDRGRRRSAEALAAWGP